MPARRFSTSATSSKSFPTSPALTSYKTRQREIPFTFRRKLLREYRKLRSVTDHPLYDVVVGPVPPLVFQRIEVRHGGYRDDRLWADPQGASSPC
jgi:hypothetical protein